jgi:hypothetical protein
MNERKPKRISIFGPVLLIAVGVILLLNSLGILEWGIWWSLLRLWPILLIAAGLDLLLGRFSIWGSLLAALLVLAVLGGALWLALDGDLGGRGLQAQEIRQTLGEATQADVRVEPGVGILRLEALPESADLIQGTIYLSKGEEIAQDVTAGEPQIRYELRTLKTSWATPLGGWNTERTWDLGLTPGAALDLAAILAVGEADLNLSDLAMSDLQVEVGLGRIELTLPAEGRFEGRLQSGMGQIVIRVPQGMALQIGGDLGLVVRDVPEGYQQDDDSITSPGYAVAENRVDLTIDEGIGILEIRPAE